MKRLAVILLSVAFLVPGLARAEGPTITVTGQGQVSRAPDMATISLSVTASAPNAAAAVAQVAKNLTGVLDRLKAEGVAEPDMQTSGLALSPVWETPRPGSNAVPKITGFSASSAVSVKVRALDHLGGVLDGVVKDGANGFAGLEFGLADPAPAQDDARKAAVADALHKAALYAAAAGVKLGAVQSIADQDGGGPRPVMMKAAPMFAEAAPMPVAQGEVTLQASVTMVFAIGP